MSNGLDPDQARRFVGPDLGPNCFQRLSADNKICHWQAKSYEVWVVLLDFSLTVKAATLIFISGCGLAISSAKEGKSGFIYNLVNSK